VGYVDPVDLIEAARTYKGARFEHAGRNHAGVDCIGLIVKACEDVGVVLDDEKLYSNLPHPSYFLKRLRDQLREVDVSEVQAGAVGFFWIAQPRLKRHVGLFTERGEGLLHAYDLAKPQPGRVLEGPFGQYWQEHIAHLFLIPGIQWQQ